MWRVSSQAMRLPHSVTAGSVPSKRAKEVFALHEVKASRKD